MGVPLAIIHFRWGFSMETIHFPRSVWPPSSAAEERPWAFQGGKCLRCPIFYRWNMKKFDRKRKKQKVVPVKSNLFTSGFQRVKSHSLRGQSWSNPREIPLVTHLWQIRMAPLAKGSASTRTWGSKLMERWSCHLYSGDIISKFRPNWTRFGYFWGYYSLNVLIEHHPNFGDIISNRYLKAMFKIPKMGHLPNPIIQREFSGPQIPSISGCMLGFLKMGDPQVTMGFNTKNSSIQILYH